MSNLATDTVADLLAEIHPCQWHARRSLDRFRRVAEAREGLFWSWVLDADPTDLDPETARYVSTVWRMWLAGKRPFKRGRRNVGAT